MMKLDWAKNEVKLAIDEILQNIECDEKIKKSLTLKYRKALKAYKRILENGEYPAKIMGYPEVVLTRLLNGLPLTCIYDTEESWHVVSDVHYYKCMIYQHDRYPSLLKFIIKGEGVYYWDSLRYYYYDINKTNSFNSSALSYWLEELLDEQIYMPYYPQLEKNMVLCEGYEDENVDIIKLFSIVRPDGSTISIEKCLEYDVENRKYVEISAEKFEEIKENLSFEKKLLG